jgi:tight adherence protein C
MEILIFFLSFISILLLFLGLYFYFQFRQERKEIVKRIEESAGLGVATANGKRTYPLITNRILSYIEKFGAFLTPRKKEDLSNLRLLFWRAGYRAESAPIIFFGFKGILAIAFMAGAFILRALVFTTLPPLRFTTLSVILAIIGFFLPNLWLKLKTLHRKEKIQQGLPDALDLMVVCVEAGQGLDAAINRIGEEMQFENKILSQEFKWLSLELRAGKSRNDALKSFAQRTDTEDANNLVSLLIQTERFGTSIAQALRVHADFMRTKRFQKAEEIAAKMPLKLLFPLIFLIFPLFLLIAAGPAVIGLFRAFQ